MHIHPSPRGEIDFVAGYRASGPLRLKRSESSAIRARAL
jgi:hypothetical protein